MDGLNLSSLKFTVETGQLKEALTDIKALRTELGKPLPEKKVKPVDTTEQAKTNARASKVTVDMLEREKDILKFMTQEYTRGQASKLAYAKATGYTTDKIKEMGDVLKVQRTLIGGDPFDKSTAGLERLRNEYRETTEAIKQFDMQSGLSGKQSRELARDKLRMEEAGKSNGTSPASIGSTIGAYEQDFVKQANLNNTLINSEKELARVHRETSNATRWVSDEMERSSATLAAMSGGMDNGARSGEKYAQSIARFSQRVRQSGVDSTTAAKQIQAYTAQQHSLQKLEQEHQGKYLSRALAPQISDIAVSLQGGMNPLTVMMQQGMQVRDLIGSVNLDAQQLQTAMRGAASGFVQSIAGTAKAIGTLIGGAFLDAGKSVTNYAAKISGVAAIQDHVNQKLQAQVLVSGQASTGVTILTRAVSGLGAVLTGLVATGLAAAVIALGAVVVGFYKAFKEGEALSKQMAINGGAFGLTKDSAYALAASMNEVGVTTKDAVTAISEITKYSSLASQNISMITQSAVDMEKHTGVAIADTIKAFADLAKDPLEGIMKLAIETGKVSPAVVQLVADLTEQGKKTEAVTVATEAMVAAYKKTTDQVVDNSGSLVRVAKVVGAAFKNMWDDVLNVGRPQTALDKLNDAEKKLSMSANYPGADTGKLKEDVKRLKSVLAFDQAVADQEKRNAAGAEAYARFQKRDEELVSKKVKLKRELTITENDYNTAIQRGFKISEADYNKQVAGIKKKYEEKGSSGSRSGENKALAEFKKASESYTDLVNKGSGYNADYNNQLASLDLLKQKGKLLDGTVFTQQMYNQAVEDLNKKQPFYIEQQRQKKELADQALKDQEILNDLLGNAAGLQNSFNDKAESLGRILASGKGSVDEILAAYAELEKQQPENKRIEKVNEYLNKQKEVLTGLQSEVGLLELQSSIVGKAPEEQKKIIREYQIQRDLVREIAEIQAQAYMNPEDKAKAIQQANEIAKMKQTQGIKDDALEMKKQYQAEFDSLTSGVADSIYTALTEGGEAGSKKLRDLIMAEMQKPIKVWIEALVKGDFSSLTGGSGGGDLTDTLGKLWKGAQSLFGGGSSGDNLMASQAATSGKELSIGSSATGGFDPASMASTIGSYVGPMMQAYGLQKSISRGYKVGDGKLVDAATALASLIPGVGPLIAGVVGGVFNRAFGRKLTDVGIRGTWKDGKSSAENFKKEKGGWFRSDKIETSALGQRQGDKITQEMDTLKESTARMIETLGFGAESVRNFNGSFIANFLGLSESDAMKEWESELLNIQGKMAETVPGLAAFAKEGETVGDAFKRLASEVKDAIAEAGISAQDMTRIIRDGLLGRLSEQQVGEQMTEMIVGGIYNALVGGFAQQITNAFMSQIITPVFTAIMAGVPLSAAVTSAAISKVVADTQSALAALKIIITNPEIQAAIKDIGNLTQTAFAGIGSVSASLPVMTSSMNGYAGATDAANKAAEEAKRIAEERAGLERRLLELQGNTAAIRARDLSEIHASNRALQQQVWALEDAKDAWSSVADSIVDEINRIRDEILGTSPDAQSASMALFESLTAQARAGNATAAERLPELSQNILELAGGNSVTLAELQRTRALIAASLEQTNRIVQGFLNPGSITGSGTVTTAAGTTNTSGQAPAASVSMGNQSVVVNVDNTAVIAQLQNISTAMNNVSIQTQAAALSNNAIRRVFDRVAQDGDSFRTTVV